jgi:hypothetical protein
MPDLKFGQKTSEYPRKAFRMVRGAKKKINKALFQKLYYEENKSLAEIGRMFSVSRIAIHKIAKDLGIERRNKSQARALAQKAGKLAYDYKNIDETFFSKWSPEMAYVLGFLFADGCMQRRKTMKGEYNILSLSIKEKGHLEKINNLMKSDHPLKIYSHQEIYHLNIANQKIVADLLKLGLVPKKSLIVKFPEVPDEYAGAFIRGEFDGDGCISMRPRSGGTATFISGSKDFICILKNKLESLAMVSDRKLQVRILASGRPFYAISYSNKLDLSKLFNFMYDKHAVDNRIYLTRKYLKFKEAIGQYLGTESYAVDSSALSTNELEKAE